MQTEPRYMLTVRVPAGIVVRDTPRSQSVGGIALRTEKVGNVLYATQILNIKGVPYARLVPRDPFKPEWVRVAEADHSIEYVEVVELEPQAGDENLQDAIRDLTSAILTLASRSK